MRSALASILATLLTLAPTGCGGGGAVRPDDMSAAEHRREAEREREQADEHATRHDVSKIRRTPERPLSGGGPEDYTRAPGVHDPAARELREADRHRAHAAEHEAAAAELERFEEAECGAVPSPARASCPLLAPAVAIVDIEAGVRVELAAGTDVASIVGHMRCHYAYARTRGFAVAAACPLYVKGIEIRMTADGKGIEITARDRATIELVRQRAREEAVPAGPTTL